jgi:Fic family protein
LRLRRINRIRTIHGSLAIEGNTLTFEQVTAVIEEESMTIDQAISNLKVSLQAAYAVEDRLKKLLKRNGLLP